MKNSETKILAIIGSPIVHSKSPLMHNTMLDFLGLNYHYIAFNVLPEDLANAINGIRALNISGFNVTIPHKVEVMKYLDEISTEAKEIGAVNTVINENGKLIGYNTDGAGYVRSLVEDTNINLKGKNVLLLGAGGAARAIGYTLSEHQVEHLIIVNRNLEKATHIKSKLGNNCKVTVVTPSNIKEYIDNTDIIINTTSVGMHPNTEESLIKKEWIKPNHLVSDIVYNPLITKLLLDAHNAGAQTHSGLGMFVHQGAIAFEKWTGITPNSRIMRNTVVDSLTAINN